MLTSEAYLALVRPLEQDASWYRFWFLRAVFRENEAYKLGRRSVGGYDAMFLERYRRFVHRMTDTAIDSSMVNILPRRTVAEAPSPFPFKILGVRYATYDLKLWVNSVPEAVRRAWFVTRARRVADEDAALDFLRSDAFDPFGEAVFETPEADRLGLPPTPPPPEATPLTPAITVTEPTPEHLIIELGPHPAGYLVLSEIFYPGWRATSEGEALPVHRADAILRAVPLEPRHTRVDLVFAPPSVRWGAALTGLSLLLVAAGLRWSGRAARRTPCAPPRSSG
jgi:hypothetical protein